MSLPPPPVAKKDDESEFSPSEMRSSGRRIGFPNFKYLDPDYNGPQIREHTMYKEYMAD